MEKGDIIAGLRSALARGYSLEFAKKSFINAGYSVQDVDDSARVVNSGSSGFTPSVTSSVSLTPKSTLPVAPIISETPKSVSPNAPVDVQNQSKYKPLPVIPSGYNSRPTIPAVNDSSLNSVQNKKSAGGRILLYFLLIIFVLVLGFLGLLIFSRPTAESLLKSLGLM